jgi:HEAT repeat protein
VAVALREHAERRGSERLMAELLSLAREGSPSQKELAEAALARMRRAREGRAALAWKRYLGPRSENDRDVAFSELMRLGPAGHALVPEMIALLGREKERWAVVDLLGRVGPAARPAVPVLLKRLRDRDLDHRARAATALVRIAPTEAGPAIPVLLERLRDPGHSERRFELLEELRRLGPTAAPAAAALKELAQGALRQDLPDGELAGAILGALAAIDSGAARELAGAGREALARWENFMPGNRQGVLLAETVSKLGPASPEVVPPLMRALTWSDDSGRTELRDRAARRLVELGPANPAVAPALIEALLAAEPVRQRARQVLAALGPAVAPALLAEVRSWESLKDGQRTRAPEVVRLLGAAGAPAEAVELLLPLLRDEDREMRRAAEEAVRRYPDVAREVGLLRGS